MAQYMNENEGTIEAHQWFRNGDHPDDKVGEWAEDQLGGRYMRQEGAVVQFFRHPDLPGDERHDCGRKWDDHGWIDQGPDGITVCPGDYIHDLDYIHVRIGRADFESVFKLDLEELERRILALLPPLGRKPHYPDFGYMLPQSQIAYADTRVIADPDGKVLGLGACPPVLNLLDLPQVWVDGVELPHVRSVDVELTYGRCEADYTIKVESPHISYTICTTSLTLKPKEKS